MVDDWKPVAEESTFAARPVGARRTHATDCSRKARTRVPKSVVLPVPAYPLSRKQQSFFQFSRNSIRVSMARDWSLVRRSFKLVIRYLCT